MAIGMDYILHFITFIIIGRLVYFLGYYFLATFSVKYANKLEYSNKQLKYSAFAAIAFQVVYLLFQIFFLG